MNKFTWITIFLGLGLIGLAIGRLASSPVRFDEAEFVEMAAAASRHGGPRIPKEEDLRIPIHSDRFTEKYGERLGMWHTPLYTLSLAVVGKFVGFSDSAMRLVGLVWSIANVALLICLCRQVRASPTAIPLVIGLFGLTPLLREGILYVDIDNTALAATGSLFLWLYLRFEKRKFGFRVLILGASFALCLWTKPTNPVILAAAAFSYELFRARFRSAFIDVTFIVLVGIALFAATYGIYCATIDYPWFFFLDYSFVSKQGQVTGQRSLSAVFQSLRWNIVWSSPAIFGAILVICGLRLQAWIRHRTLQPIDLLVGFVVLGFAAYVFKAATIGKYTFPFVATALVPIVYELVPLRIHRPRFLVGMGLLAFVLAILFIPNLQWKPPSTGDVPSSIKEILLDPRMVWLAVAGITTAGIACAFSIASSNAPMSKRFLMGLLVSAVLLNPIDAWKGMLFGFDGRAPLRPYIENGLLATCDYIVMNGKPGDVIMGPKDIGIRLSLSSKFRYRPMDTVEKPELIPQAHEDGTVRFYIEHHYFEKKRPAELKTSRTILQEKDFGFFTLYEFKTAL
jgi:hypothetical protein